MSNIKQDDGAREVHGVANNEGNPVVTVSEQLDGWIFVKTAASFGNSIRPASARCLARQLYRLARRIEAREIEP